MDLNLNRRAFLKMGALLLPGLAYQHLAAKLNWTDNQMVGRIAIASVSVYSKPSDKSPILYQRSRDEVINLYEPVTSSESPVYNPVWYRVWRGYIHSARVQIVHTRLNPVANSISTQGQLGEITVPATYPLYHRDENSWTPLYPLYYESVHWITGIIEGPDQMPWYQITEAWSQDKYYVPAEHVRLILPEEISPLSVDVPAWKKRIEISIARQTLVAFEEDKEVFSTTISSGLNRQVEGEVPWRTPTGEFNVMSKMPSQHMGDDPITSDVSGYVLPGVPWVSYFHESGVAMHGTYWHNNYGVPMSHGCINMRPEEARWIYRWTTPAPQMGQRETRGNGTQVSVH
jgi:lipoprotein-anchoring transpeptidase ErfK/SrfK